MKPSADGSSPASEIHAESAFLDAMRAAGLDYAGPIIADGALHRIKVNGDRNPNSFYTRSDHYSYATKGIPIAFFFTGTHPDYHQASDSVEKILFPKLQRITQMVYEAGFNVANREQPLVRDNLGSPTGLPISARLLCEAASLCVLLGSAMKQEGRFQLQTRTDGVVDAIDEAEEEFGQDRLEAVLFGNREKPAQAVVDAILAAVRDHTCDAPLLDDITLWVLKRNV